MAWLREDLIFPNHPITSLWIRGFWSPQQLSRQGLPTAFPYRCVLCCVAAKSPNGSPGSYCALFKGLFIPAIVCFDGPNTQRHKRLQTFVSDPVPLEAFHAVRKSQVGIESSLLLQTNRSAWVTAQGSGASPCHEPRFALPAYTWAKGLLLADRGRPPVCFVFLDTASCSEQCRLILPHRSLGRMLQTYF